MVKSWSDLSKRTRKFFTIIVIVVIVGSIISVVSYINISRVVIYPTLDNKGYSYPDSFVIPSGWEASGQIYNYTSTGYMNLSSPGCTQTYRYFLEAFKVPQLKTIDDRAIAFLESGVIVFWLVLVNKTIGSPFTSVAKNVSSVSLYDEQDSHLNPSFTVRSNIGYPPFSNLPSMHAAALITGGWSNVFLLHYDSGLHHFIFKLSVTPYSNMGPFKFAGNPVPLSFEWNGTVGNK